MTHPKSNPVTAPNLGRIQGMKPLPTVLPTTATKDEDTKSARLCTALTYVSQVRHKSNIVIKNSNLDPTLTLVGIYEQPYLTIAQGNSHFPVICYYPPTREFLSSKTSQTEIPPTSTWAVVFMTQPARQNRRHHLFEVADSIWQVYPKSVIYP